MAVYSYMADVVPVEARTKRMGWLDAIWYLGGPIGTWLGGWLYHSYGYVTVFAVSGVLWFICLLYVVFVIKETVVPSAAIDLSSPGGCCEMIADLGQTAVQSYPHNGRFYLYSLMALKLGVFLSQGHQVIYRNLFYSIAIFTKSNLIASSSLARCIYGHAVYWAGMHRSIPLGLELMKLSTKSE